MPIARVADFQDPDPFRRQNGRDRSIDFGISRQDQSTALCFQGIGKAERKRQRQSPNAAEYCKGACTELLCGMCPEIVSFHGFEEF